MSRKKSGGVSWIKKEEPKFIRQFKERIAYKEQANTNTKKKVADNDLIIEKEEDRPQVVQLKSGDLGEKEYLELKSKEDIENAASSFGKILFKKRPKKNPEEAVEVEEATSSGTAAKKTELDLIFNLDKEGKEVEKAEEDLEEKSSETEPVKKKILLDDEEDKEKTYGLQEPPVKKRFIDGAKIRVETHSAKRVLEREAKSGNKKLLSFYDEEQEEIEEYNRELYKKKLEKEEAEEDNDDDDE